VWVSPANQRFADGANPLPAQTNNKQTAARQITSFVNKTTDANVVALWDKNQHSIRAAFDAESPSMSLADLFALAFIRQHSIFATRRPMKAMLSSLSRPPDDPSVRNATVSGVQLGVLRYMLHQIPQLRESIIKWLMLFLDLDEAGNFLQYGRYQLCLNGAALDPGSTLAELPTHLVYQLLRRSGWTGATYPPANPADLRKQLTEHQASHWLGAWHETVSRKTFARIIAQLVQSDVGDISTWATEVVVPCLVSAGSSKDVHAAVLILLGLCKHLEDTQDSGAKKAISRQVEDLGEQVLEGCVDAQADTAECVEDEDKHLSPAQAKALQRFQEEHLRTLLKSL